MSASKVEGVNSGSGGGGLDEAVFVGVDEQAEATALDVELVVDDGEVVADGRLGDDGAQALGDLFVLQPLADERDDLAPALGRRPELGGVGAGAFAPPPPQNPPARAGLEPVVARAV